MRRVLGLILVGSLCLNLPPVLAHDSAAQKKKKKVERVDEKPYVGGYGASGQPVASECHQDGVACARFPVEKGEKFAALEISDVAGQSVYASVYIFGYTDGNDTHEHICGATDKPLPLAPGLDELVVVPAASAGNATPVCTGVPTQGTVTVTFSNMP